MWEALREAVDEEMEADPNVCVIGMLVITDCISLESKLMTPFTA